MLRKILGFILIAAPLWAVFFLITNLSDIGTALAFLAAVVIIAAIVAFGVRLLFYEGDA